MTKNKNCNHAAFCIGCSTCRADHVASTGRTGHRCGHGRSRHVLLKCRVPGCHYWPTYAITSTSRRNGGNWYTLKMCRGCLFHNIEVYVYNVPESFVIPGWGSGHGEESKSHNFKLLAFLPRLLYCNIKAFIYFDCIVHTFRKIAVSNPDILTCASARICLYSGFKFYRNLSPLDMRSVRPYHRTVQILPSRGGHIVTRNNACIEL